MLKRFALFVMTAVVGFGSTISNVLAAGDVPTTKHEPAPWEMWFQPAASPSAERIDQFHYLVFAIEVAIVVFVLVMMGYICVRFSKKNNPVPSKTTHNTLLEVIWTGVPIIILAIIVVPSLKLLYFVDHHQDPDMTIKVIGNQWYWSYEYPENGDFQFDSMLVDASDLKPGQPRLLTVDNPLVVPVGANVRVLLTTNDVIHDWAVPSLGLKTDATPGRVDEDWFRIDSEGTYYGQCSELCGVNHGFMPIQIEAVSKVKFQEWVEKAKAEYAQNGDIPDIYAMLKADKNTKVAQAAQ